MKKNNGMVLFNDEYNELFPRKDLQTIELLDDIKLFLDEVLGRIMYIDTSDLISGEKVLSLDKKTELSTQFFCIIN